jgi:hypothetical protein
MMFALRAIGWSAVSFAVWVLYPVLPARLLFHVEQKLTSTVNDLASIH